MSIDQGMLVLRVPYENLQEVSNDLLMGLNDDNIEPGVAFAALALSIGRMHPQWGKLDTEQELKFVNELLGWVSMYFAPDQVN